MSESKQSDCEDEFDILMDTLAHLEDMLFDEVSFGGNDDDEDDAWNLVASKTGEGIREELKEFEERWALPAFMRRPGEGKEGDDDEGPKSSAAADGIGGGGGCGASSDGAMFTVEQHQLHQRFASLVEGHVEKFLGEKYGSNPAQKLIAAITCASASSAGDGGGGGGKVSGFKFVENNWARDAGREVLSLLREVEDFEVWATEMARKARLRDAFTGSPASAVRVYK